MPSATAGGANLSAYFKLDGTRNITGPTTIINNVPLLASDVLTIRGAAGQTGKLLTLETSALADVFSVDNAGKLIYTTDLPGVVGGDTTAYQETVTLATNPASSTPSAYGTTYGRSLIAIQGSGATFKNWRGHYLSTVLAGKYTEAFGQRTDISSSSANAASDMSAGYFRATHTGAGLLSSIEALQVYATATGPAAQMYSIYNLADNQAAATDVYGLYSVAQNRNSAAISATLTGAFIRANLQSGTAGTVIALDVGVLGLSGTTKTRAIKATGNIELTGIFNRLQTNEYEFSFGRNTNYGTAQLRVIDAGVAGRGFIITNSGGGVVIRDETDVVLANLNVASLSANGMQAAGLAALSIIGSGNGITFSDFGAASVTYLTMQNKVHTYSDGSSMVFGATNGMKIGDAASKIGFFGVTAIARAILATGASATVDDVITALQNLGLVKQS